MLYLSRVPLNPYSAPALKLADSLENLHKLAGALFAGRSESKFLFRVDAGRDGPDVLIQSQTLPDWEKLYLAPRDLRQQPSCKELKLFIAAGDIYAFRLLARPTRRKSIGKQNGRGIRKDVRTDDERLEWLKDKGERCGFQIMTCGVTLQSFPAIHSDRDWKERGGSFTGVRFDGELIVSNSGAFEDAIGQGIGVQKSFGFGLLSLARG